MLICMPSRGILFHCNALSVKLQYYSYNKINISVRAHSSVLYGVAKHGTDLGRILFDYFKTWERVLLFVFQVMRI